jgi:prophage antirepressor-like protein
MSKALARPQLTRFTFKSTEVRTVEKDGLIWFVASDIAKALNYADATHMTRSLDDDERGLHIVETPSGNQEVTIINESGLYHALLKSRKPEAQPFRKWVTSEVLPAIRKDGHYAAQPAAAPKALPKRDVIQSELQGRINRRAWELSHASYELYRRQMQEDAMVKGGHTKPEDWQPVECQRHALESIEIVAGLLTSFSGNLRRDGRDLAGLVGLDFDQVAQKFRPPQG